MNQFCYTAVLPYTTAFGNLKSDVNWALASRTNLVVKALFQLNSGIKQKGQDMFQINRRQILV